MYRKLILLAGVVDLFILSLLDKVAFQHYLYWRFPWFDVVMHLVGGIAIGLVSAYAYWEWQKENNINAEDSKYFYVFNLGFILFLGAGWEVFEIMADRIVKFDPVNILQDLLIGTIGSLLAGLIVLWIHNYNLKRLK
jgi:hypothetical protein